MFDVKNRRTKSTRRSDMPIVSSLCTSNILYAFLVVSIFADPSISLTIDSEHDTVNTSTNTFLESSSPEFVLDLVVFDHLGSNQIDFAVDRGRRTHSRLISNNTGTVVVHHRRHTTIGSQFMQCRRTSCLSRQPPLSAQIFVGCC